MTNKVTDFPEQTDPTEGALLYLVQSGNDYRLPLGTLHDMPVNGFADYNHAGATIPLVADTWTPVINDGAGAFTNLAYLPKGVTSMLNTATGKIDASQLDLGDDMVIRNDFTVVPSLNNSAIEMRYTLGAGGNAYTLTGSRERLDLGAGVAYRLSLLSHYIYMGDSNTRDNPIGIEIRCTGAAVVTNAGIAIGVKKR